MPNTSFQIHQQLLSDTHELLLWQNCHIRLHKNAALPWVIIIPISTEIEFYELSENLQLTITRISQIIGGYFKLNLGAEKINFAAIGNVVQQLHIHVIGRHHKDPLWPDVVWGNKLPDAQYKSEEVNTIKTNISKLLEQHT